MLGLARDASEEQIRAAYRRLARQHHPDLDPGPDAARRFRAVNEAYRSLTGRSRQAPGDVVPGNPAPAAPDHAPAQPPEPAESPQPAGSPLAAASILVLLAAVCAPGPLLLCGVLLAPVGALLGHVARRQARREGRPPSGLAQAGVVVGWALTAVLLAAVAVGVLVSRG